MSGKPIPEAVRQWLEEWCDDHGVELPADAYNELLESLTAAQQQGGGEVLARGWLHRRGPGDDYDVHDEESGAGDDCVGCVPCVIVRADIAPASAPVDTATPPSVPVGVEGFDAWWKSHSIDPEFPETMDDRTFAKAAWDAALSQQPAAVDGARWLVFNVGCIECGVSSDVVGVYATQEEAERVAEICAAELDWREGGQNSFEVFDLRSPQAEEYCQALAAQPGGSDNDDQQEGA